MDGPNSEPECVILVIGVIFCPPFSDGAMGKYFGDQNCLLEEIQFDAQSRRILVLLYLQQ